MKKVIFILSICLCAAITLGFLVMDRMSDDLRMSKMNVYCRCNNKTNATVDDVGMTLWCIVHDIKLTSPEIYTSALKINCFIGCLQKNKLTDGTITDTENIIKALDKELAEESEKPGGIAGND